jgi:hypothetical protein
MVKYETRKSFSLFNRRFKKDPECKKNWKSLFVANTYTGCWSICDSRQQIYLSDTAWIPLREHIAQRLPRKRSSLLFSSQKRVGVLSIFPIKNHETKGNSSTLKVMCWMCSEFKFVRRFAVIHLRFYDYCYFNDKKSFEAN